jgi:Fe-Mn family superoxide dismutase
MIFTLPPLPYATNALEPTMSQQTIEYHYGKHLQTYIDNLNRLTEDTPYSGYTLEHLILTTTGPVFNNAAQVWNHTFFFDTLTPEPTKMPSELEFALTRDFGSVEEFKARFKKAATDIFGSGWAWLAQDNAGTLHIIQESNAGNPMRAGYKPLMTIDVWEHAYYIDYRNRRSEFIEKCWDLINWKKVAKRMHEDMLTAHITDMSETKIDNTIELAVEEMTVIEKPTKNMERYVCIICGWVYDPAEGDPENGIAPGTPFDEIPEDWLCPACGVGKDYFEKER